MLGLQLRIYSSLTSVVVIVELKYGEEILRMKNR
jgi:hypothetical protein